MRKGSWVRLKQRVRSGPQKAQILVEDDDYAVGAVKLSAPLGGFRWWNKDDLIVAPQRKKK